MQSLDVRMDRQKVLPEKCGLCPLPITNTQLDSGIVVLTKIEGGFRLVHEACYEKRKLLNLVTPGATA